MCDSSEINDYSSLLIIICDSSEINYTSLLIIMCDSSEINIIQAY